MAIELKAEPRAGLGKEICKKLRAKDILPGNLYGGPLKEPQAVSFPLHATELTMKKHGKNADYSVLLEGKTYPVKVQEVEVEPIYKGFLHLDLLVTGDE